MGIVWKNGSREKLSRLGRRLTNLVSDFGADVELAADHMADAIVQTTLAGIAEGDVPFKAYSPAYAETIELAGGKPSGVVDLRGIFEKQKPKRPYSERQRLLGAGQQGIKIIELAGRRFAVRTKVTRPRLGMVDPQSEMSRDLITVERGLGTWARIVYRPRSKNYMIGHQKTRRWFSVKKAAVVAAGIATLTTAFSARCDRFNAGE